MTTVVLADDHPLVRQGLRAVFESTDEIQVVAESDNGLDAVRLCVEHRPDVVLMDLQLPGLHGIEATRRVRTGSPETVVLVLTMFEDDDTVFAAVAAGAAGYLLKGSAGADIVAAVRAAAAGQAVFGSALTSRLPGLVRTPAHNPRRTTLSGTHRPRAPDPRRSSRRPYKRRDRSQALPLAQDRREQRHHHPLQTSPDPPDGGDRPGQTGGPRTGRGSARPTDADWSRLNPEPYVAGAQGVPGQVRRPMLMRGAAEGALP